MIAAWLLCALSSGFPGDADGDAYAATGGDWDDLDPAVHPGARETWYDGVDSDCDGVDGPDADGADIVPAGGDGCDDENPSVSPSAVEVAGDVDDDCDGFLGAVSQTTAEAGVAIYSVFVHFSPGVGAAVAGGLDLSGDGEPDLVVGAPGTTDARYGISGAAYLVLSPMAGSGALESAGYRYADAVDSGGFGAALAHVGDLDADGLPELLIGAPSSGRWATRAGVAWLVAGAAWLP